MTRVTSLHDKAPEYGLLTAKAAFAQTGSEFFKNIGYIGALGFVFSRAMLSSLDADVLLISLNAKGLLIDEARWLVGSAFVLTSFNVIYRLNNIDQLSAVRDYDPKDHNVSIISTLNTVLPMIVYLSLHYGKQTTPNAYAFVAMALFYYQMLTHVRMNHPEAANNSLDRPIRKFKMAHDVGHYMLSHGANIHLLFSIIAANGIFMGDLMNHWVAPESYTSDWVILASSLMPAYIGLVHIKLALENAHARYWRLINTAGFLLEEGVNRSLIPDEIAYIRVREKPVKDMIYLGMVATLIDFFGVVLLGLYQAEGPAPYIAIRFSAQCATYGALVSLSSFRASSHVNTFYDDVFHDVVASAPIFLVSINILFAISRAHLGVTKYVQLQSCLANFLIVSSCLYLTTKHRQSVDASNKLKMILNLGVKRFKDEAFGIDKTPTEATLYNTLLGVFFSGCQSSDKRLFMHTFFDKVWETVSLDLKKAILGRVALAAKRNTHIKLPATFFKDFNVYLKNKTHFRLAKNLLLLLSLMPDVDRSLDAPEFLEPETQEQFLALLESSVQGDMPLNSTQCYVISRFLLGKQQFWAAFKYPAACRSRHTYHHALLNLWFQKIFTPEHAVSVLNEISGGDTHTRLDSIQLSILLECLSRCMTPALNNKLAAHLGDLSLFSALHLYWDTVSVRFINNSETPVKLKAFLLNGYWANYVLDPQFSERILSCLVNVQGGAVTGHGEAEQKQNRQTDLSSRRADSHMIERLFALLQPELKYMVLLHWIACDFEPSIKRVLGQLPESSAIWQAVLLVSKNDDDAANILDARNLSLACEEGDEALCQFVLERMQYYSTRPRMIASFFEKISSACLVDRLMLVLLKTASVESIEAIPCHLSISEAQYSHYFSCLIDQFSQAVSTFIKPSLLWLVGKGVPLKTQGLLTRKTLAHLIMEYSGSWTLQNILALPLSREDIKVKDSGGNRPITLPKFPSEDMIAAAKTLLFKAGRPKAVSTSLYEIMRPCDIEDAQYASAWAQVNTDRLEGADILYAAYSVKAKKAHRYSLLVSAAITYASASPAEKANAVRQIKKLAKCLLTQGSDAKLSVGIIDESVSGVLSLSIWVYAPQGLAALNIVGDGVSPSEASSRSTERVAFVAQDDEPSDDDVDVAPAAEPAPAVAVTASEPATAAASASLLSGRVFVLNRGNVPPQRIFSSSATGAVGAGVGAGGAAGGRRRQSSEARLRLGDHAPSKGSSEQLINDLRQMGLRRQADGSYDVIAAEDKRVISNDEIFRYFYRPSILTILQNLCNNYMCTEGRDSRTVSRLRAVRNNLTHFSIVSPALPYASAISQGVFKVAANCLNQKYEMGVIGQLLSLDHLGVYDMSQSQLEEAAFEKFKDSVAALKVVLGLLEKRSASLDVLFVAYDRTPEAYAVYHHVIQLIESIKILKPNYRIDRLYKVEVRRTVRLMKQSDIKLLDLVSVRNELVHETDGSGELGKLTPKMALIVRQVLGGIGRVVPHEHLPVLDAPSSSRVSPKHK
jgi:hypothetical protein